LLSLAAFSACDKASLTHISGHDLTVGFYSAVPSTRSSICADGLSASWEVGDNVCLWAISQQGETVLDAWKFGVYAISDNLAWFSSTLQSPLADGQYRYLACSPAPVSVTGTSATFIIPSDQDGKASDGGDIMVATPCIHGPVRELPDPEDQSGLKLVFNHIVHLLRFFISSEDAIELEGERIKTIALSMPKSVVGTVRTDLTDPFADAVLEEGRGDINIGLEDGLEESGEVRHYAYASIAPTEFGPEDVMAVRLYTETKVATVADIALRGRKMAAGHATAVRLKPASVSDLFRLRVSVESNNLGEKVNSISLKAPQGCHWTDGGSSEYVFSPSTAIDAGSGFELQFEDESSFRSLSGRTVTVTYDSPHAVISREITMPDMSSGFAADLHLNVPYLLYEDFSSVASFSSNDEYATLSMGSKSPHTFLGGWSGGRIGAEAGQCVRLACRRETSSDYPARLDSAPIDALLKSGADLKVTFDYGANNRYGGIAIITDGNVGQTCSIGYTTGTGTYWSGDKTGEFEESNSFYVKEYSGSYSLLPNNNSYIIHSVPQTDCLRICWRTDIEHQAGTTNTTAWLYVDNVKVQISE